jgi:DNA repair exonuclease SbcCD ATPase subunit
MVSFLKGRRREDDTVVAVDSSGRNVTVALEALVGRAEAAANDLRSLAPLLERAAEFGALRERCEELEGQVEGLLRLGGQLALAEEQAERVIKTQAATEARIGHAGEDVERLQSQMGGLSDKVETALLLREQVESFLSLQGPLASLRTDAETLRTQLSELSEGVTRMRTQHDDALTAHRHTTSRLENFDQDFQAATGKLEDVVRRVQSVERAIEPINQASTAIPDVQHQLAVLKALADQVAQKTTMLEQEREAVDRAATQIAQLTRMDRELDAWLRRQEEQIRRFGPIEAKITEIKTIQDKVLSRTEELQGTSQKIEDAQQSARQALTDLREQMRKSSEGFELEHRSLHAVSERIADLRKAVKECEARLGELDAATQGTAAVQTQVRSVGEQIADLAKDVNALSQEAVRASTLRQDVGRLDNMATELASRMRRLDEIRPGVEQAVEQLATLKGTRELLSDGLEQMRVAYEEMSRLREGHGETQAWLANADVWTRKVQTQVKELSGLEPVVERIRQEVEQVKRSMEQIEAGRDIVQQVHTSLLEVGSMNNELRERTDGLRSRMEAAETRFGQLSKQAEGAQRLSDTISVVTASVEDAERRMGMVDESVRGLESRTQQIDQVEERIRLLGQELDQRQGALDKATEHLTRASALRKEAAEAAHRMEEVTRTVGGTLSQAQEQAGGLQQLAGELEARAGALKSIDRQVTHFEELLSKWESAQTEAGKALEQTLARQAGVEAIEAQVKHVFDLAERTIEDVQTIGSARREIEETRTMLLETQEQFKTTEETLAGFESRKRQLERAEQRLARAEALALGIRATVESLTAQKTVVDHAMESAGALGFQMKQAEALIGALRRERDLACDLKAAVSALSDEGEEPAPSGQGRHQV